MSSKTIEKLSTIPKENEVGPPQQLDTDSPIETVVQNGRIRIRSTVESNHQPTVILHNPEKVKESLLKLGSIHHQNDTETKKEFERINEEIQNDVDRVIVRACEEHDEIVRRAKRLTQEIDNDYRRELETLLDLIDRGKAQRIVDLENNLDDKQRDILRLAEEEIDRLNEISGRMKINLLRKAQEQVTLNIDQIGKEATQMSKTSTLHQSTNVTTIKTEVAAKTAT